MRFDTLFIVQWSGFLVIGMALLGLWALLVATRKARREFRSKGYLRIPAGQEWFRFLMFRHYDSFQGAGIRFFYGMAHTCLFALIIVVAAVGIFLGSEFLLGTVGAGPVP